jgi:tetratricopeptide repeat protein
MDLSATYSARASEQTSLKDFEGALETQRKARAIREAVAAADPTDVRANSSLAETLSRLGWTLGRLGDFNEDLKNQNRVLQTREKLCAASPENEGSQESLAKSFGNMGKAEERGGESVKFSVTERRRHLRQATLWFEKMQGVYDRLRVRGSLSHSAAKDLASCQEWIEKCNAKLAKLGSNKSAVLSRPRSKSAER